ncbi:aminotransferase class III-fold pyridoxal phosphate-dependent enzyme [Paracoccus suum]|uniref:Aminotransferase class III-fold pyridoxal phosphate-dependent enzyme n=1 Tax=Paracoccus suum TaxID=2259340 RepID=A0A344PJA0_9RHOB|nr:aminotransferase class III-fold pyridoxal phosphate-dependent enzyme [Paracoccus suum]AXC49455.1 aminotransferase class III-fold pyridoxal phosphate-dependent enzyme [Paracoccus suum]
MTTLAERDARVFLHQSSSSPVRSGLRAVEGMWIEDNDGRRLIDLHGNTAHLLGHANPEIRAALARQLDELAFCPRRYTNAPAVELAEALTARWSGRGEAGVLFAPSGSDAIEIAMRLARAATGRFETVSLDGSFHGSGFGALGLSEAVLDPRLGPHLPGLQHVAPYWGEGGAERMLDGLRQAFATSATGISAVIAEAVRSNCHMPPPQLWPEVRRVCDDHGALLIFDEIPSGLGRAGRFFAFELFDVQPDIAVLGKSLGGGVLPLAAVIADRRLDVAPDLDIGHYTHEKNPMQARAGLTTVQMVLRDDLPTRAVEIGHRLAEGIAEIAARTGRPAGLRGPAALLALELPGCGLATAELVARCRDAGLSTTGKGPQSVGLSLPLTVSDTDIDEVLSRIETLIARL